MSLETAFMTDARKSEEKNTESNMSKEESMKRLPKRLTYILRYGVLKEGLTVDSNGFVYLDELMTLTMLNEYSEEEVLHEINSSMSYRRTQRYDWREKYNRILVRAAYNRDLEKNPKHLNSNVYTLFESSMRYILNNLDDYDLEDFPDENIIRTMFRRMKREKRLNNKVLQALLVPTITRIDMEGVYLTNNSLRTLWTQCPNLTAISFKNCGYIITDTILTQIAKNLPNLAQLNLCGCSHLTANCLAILSKRLVHLKVLHISNVPSINVQTVLKFMKTAKELTFLDVFYLSQTEEEHKLVKETAVKNNVDLIVRPPKRSKSMSIEDTNNDNEEGSLSEDEDQDSIDNTDEDNGIQNIEQNEGAVGGVINNGVGACAFSNDTSQNIVNTVNNNKRDSLSDIYWDCPESPNWNESDNEEDHLWGDDYHDARNEPEGSEVYDKAKQRYEDAKSLFDAAQKNLDLATANLQSARDVQNDEALARKYQFDEWNT